MVVVGAYARIENESTRRRLERLERVDLFDLGDDSKVGLLIEASDVDEAHMLLCDVVAGVEGVLGVWPSFINVETQGTTSRMSAASEGGVE